MRAGAPIIDKSGNRVGTITSGGFGPSVGHPIALGLIDVDADGDGLMAQVRSKQIKLQLYRNILPLKVLILKLMSIVISDLIILR